MELGHGRAAGALLRPQKHGRGQGAPERWTVPDSATQT